MGIPKERDIETIRWLAEGKTAAEIGEIMCRTKWAIQTRIERLKAQTGARKETALVARAFREGWIE